jgi:hypothetical protein
VNYVGPDILVKSQYWTLKLQLPQFSWSLGRGEEGTPRSRRRNLQHRSTEKGESRKGVGVNLGNFYVHNEKKNYSKFAYVYILNCRLAFGGQYDEIKASRMNRKIQLFTVYDVNLLLFVLCRR